MLGVAISADFPWSGEASVRVTHAPGQACGLAIRVPSWCQAPRLRINGEQATDARADRGYLVVDRVWRPGDVLAWAFDIAPRWVLPHPRIDAVRGCAAIERGPLVYCLEQADQQAGPELDDAALASGTPLAERPASLPGIGRTVLVDARAVPVGAGWPQGLPYLLQGLPYTEPGSEGFGAYVPSGATGTSGASSGASATIGASEVVAAPGPPGPRGLPRAPGLR